MGSSSVDRPVMVAFIGFAGVVVAAIIGALANYMDDESSSPDPQRPQPSPIVSSPTSPAASPAAEPADAVQILLQYLPESVSSCTPDSPPLGALARVECVATPGVGTLNAALAFVLYDGVQASRQAFAEAVPASVAVSERVCPDGPDRSDYYITEGAPRSGLLACWVATDNAPYIVWTRDDPGILAVASGPVGSNLDELWVVWNSTRIGSTSGASPSPSQ
jgi:hypothetical protein